MFNSAGTLANAAIIAVLVTFGAGVFGWMVGHVIAKSRQTPVARGTVYVRNREDE